MDMLVFPELINIRQESDSRAPKPNQLSQGKENREKRETTRSHRSRMFTWVVFLLEYAMCIGVVRIVSQNSLAANATHVEHDVPQHNNGEGMAYYVAYMLPSQYN